MYGYQKQRINPYYKPHYPPIKMTLEEAQKQVDQWIKMYGVRYFSELTNMAVHRIREVDVTDKKSDIALPQADPGLFGLPWHEPRQVRIQFKAGKVVDYVRERMWSAEQNIEDLPDGGIILEMMSQSDEELMAFVRSFGESARLLSEAQR